jgi:hypothetical protein
MRLLSHLLPAMPMMAAVLLYTAAPAWAGDEIYRGHAVSVCPDIPHYPNATSYDPFDSSFDRRSARTRTTDDLQVVVGWFQAHLGPGWTYRKPPRDVWPQTHRFFGPRGRAVEIRTDVYPIEIVFSCNE